MTTQPEREGIEELDNLANIYGWHHEKCSGHSHFPSCPVVKLRRILVEEEQTHHQELQKAREEAITSAMDEMLEYTHLGAQFIDGVRTLIEARGLKLSDQSELDQPLSDKQAL